MKKLDQQLFDAVASGNRDEVAHAILSGASPNASGFEDTSPLLDACRLKMSEVAEFLLAQGADPNWYDCDGLTSLSIAARNGDEELVLLLLRHGAHIDRQPRAVHDLFDGWTPLMHACASDQLKMVQLLIGVGANINKSTERGETPLMVAAESRSNKVVEYLLAHGADPSACDDAGETAYEKALKFGDGKAAELLRKKVL